MNRIISYLAAAAAALGLASCAKDLAYEIRPDDGIQVNFKVAALNGPETKAVKTGWTTGDKINIWYDTNTQEHPDMVIKYDGNKWVKDASATISGNMPSESGTLKFFYEGFNDLSNYTVDTSDPDFTGFIVGTPNLIFKGDNDFTTGYTFENGTLTSSLDHWSPLTSLQVVISGVNPSDYMLFCGKFGYVTAIDIKKSFIGSGAGYTNFIEGVENEDGTAFYFIGTGSLDSPENYTFLLKDKVTGEEFNYTAENKAMDSEKFTAIKIPFSKFSDRYNSHEYVDLGLPSGALWATTNLGASSPEEYGDYYAWGETETYYEDGYAQEHPQAHWNSTKTGGYRNSTYKFYDLDNDYVEKYNVFSYYNSDVDNNLLLDLQDDTAYATWGGDWRIPTVKEWEELKDNCDATWTEMNGVYGYKFQSKVPGYTENWIFVPAAGYRSNTYLDFVNEGGYYWTANLYPTSTYTANNFIFSEHYKQIAGHNRSYGFSVRPVCPKEKNSGITGITLNMDEVTMEVGESLDFIATVSGSSESIVKDYVQWYITESDIAKVDVNGKVTALRPGVALLTARTELGNFIAFCRIEVKPAYIDENGHDYVDLGLSVKWATMNIGASTPTDNGKLFAWGETQTKTSFTESNYKWYHSDTILKYCNDEEYGDVDNKLTLEPDDDAATKLWGGTWRMPTKEEIQELCDNCDWTWTDDYDGVGAKGYIVTSTIDGYTDQHIFLPAAGGQTDGTTTGEGEKGYYWSSSRYPSSQWSAYLLAFDATSPYPGVYSYTRDQGFSIRGVIR